MSFNRHIRRNFNANKTNRIRYDKDNFLCQIYRFDKTKEVQYTVKNVEHNGQVVNWHGMKAIKSKNNNRVSLIFYYEANETSSNYRLEFLFGNTYLKPSATKKDSKLTSNAEIYINGVKQEGTNGSSWASNDANFSRHFQYVTLKKGVNKIEYKLTSNSVFVGLSVKKYELWEAKRHNDANDNLTLINATVEHTNELQINTMTAEFMYHHGLDELLEPTNANANRSGLIFDYRDEINLYIWDTENNKQQVFGGYISTAEVDSDLEKVTLECADRIIDLDRRYSISEIKMKNAYTSEDEDYSYGVDYLKNYNYYSQALKFLCDNCEVPLNTNVKLGSPLVVRKEKKLANYRDGGYTKLTLNGMKANVNKGSITLRNGDSSIKGQSALIYDAKDKSICLNDYPNLYFHYGLGTQMWTEERKETSVIVKDSAVSSTWVKRANSITSATGSSAIKPIWKWVAVNIRQRDIKNFYQSVGSTWKYKSGNCCCKTELMLTLLSAKGLTDLKYVHSHGGKGGHIFAKVNGFYVDPSTSSEKKGWHNYLKGYGSIVKTTTFPQKPF